MGATPIMLETGEKANIDIHMGKNHYGNRVFKTVLNGKEVGDVTLLWHRLDEKKKELVSDDYPEGVGDYSLYTKFRKNDEVAGGKRSKIEIHSIEFDDNNVGKVLLQTVIRI